MGDIKRKHKKYVRPRKLYDIKRIEEENRLVKIYGLKNKREIWKADMAIKIIRDNAKKLITASEEQKKEFIERLQKEGFNVKNISDVLSLNKEDLLKRRLQTVLLEKKLAKTAKEARQLIVHKHVTIANNIVNIPSCRVLKDMEDKISIRLNKNKQVKEGGEA